MQNDGVVTLVAILVIVVLLLSVWKEVLFFLVSLLIALTIYGVMLLVDGIHTM